MQNAERILSGNEYSDYDKAKAINTLLSIKNNFIESNRIPPSDKDYIQASDGKYYYINDEYKTSKYSEDYKKYKDITKNNYICKSTNVGYDEENGRIKSMQFEIKK